MSGKGSSPRPFSVDQKTFASNWDRIFSKQPQWDHYSDLPAPEAYKEDDHAQRTMEKPVDRG
jgi:hypothetical protein